MVRGLIRALLVLRLESRQLPIDLGLVLAMWRSQPVVEIVVAARQEAAARRAAVRRRLDEVYPF
ncbi:MAG: hypothetical protein AB1505_02990 [Candidatus Latescibacterota bacterium]